jgi:hypothetical protein
MHATHGPVPCTAETTTLLLSPLLLLLCAGQVLMSDELEKVANAMFNGKVSRPACWHCDPDTCCALLCCPFSNKRLFLVSEAVLL